ncbi:hypothetical protein BD410DRAFT_805774 [Rickenella mellea]|uniref:Uncharacterized protein n=1 Tax=Rickenella mellea TaxID=50990 RepID=A0A4Y7PW43_9AGAM|nr:hypothetical protein BD410DRAFT_805774 [Rickenella mellea]
MDSALWDIVKPATTTRFFEQLAIADGLAQGRLYVVGIVIGHVLLPFPPQSRCNYFIYYGYWFYDIRTTYRPDKVRRENPDPRVFFAGSPDSARFPFDRVLTSEGIASKPVVRLCRGGILLLMMLRWGNSKTTFGIDGMRPSVAVAYALARIPSGEAFLEAAQQPRTDPSHASADGMKISRQNFAQTRALLDPPTSWITGLAMAPEIAGRSALDVAALAEFFQEHFKCGTLNKIMSKILDPSPDCPGDALAAECLLLWVPGPVLFESFPVLVGEFHKRSGISLTSRYSDAIDLTESDTESDASDVELLDLNNLLYMCAEEFNHPQLLWMELQGNNGYWK